MEHQGLLEVRNLKKYFDTPRGPLQAVDNISFSIEKGKTLGVVGESGCGKSTLGRTILRLQEPTSGEIWFGGQDIVKYDKKQVKALRSRMKEKRWGYTGVWLRLQQKRWGIAQNGPTTALNLSSMAKYGKHDCSVKI